MPYSQHILQASIRLDRISGNYRLLCRAAAKGMGRSLPPAFIHSPEKDHKAQSKRENFQAFSWPDVMPVIKADAYGHGHIPIALHLRREGARLFASGSVREAVALRQGLSRAEEKGDEAAVISLLGIMDREDAVLAVRHGIIPVIHSFWQLSLLEEVGLPLAVALKYNTGMARLGFNPEETPLLIKSLGRLPCARPVLALSHFACADTEEGLDAICGQGRVFADVLTKLRAVWPSLAASLGNSAGTLLAGAVQEEIGANICRPGIALYGGNPFTGTSLASLGAGLLPAMSLCAPLIAVRELAAGAPIGYGHTFRAQTRMRVGIIAAGYADGYPRCLSNLGEVCVAGGRAPVLGRVAMQMTAVDLSALPDATPGEPAWLLGGPHENGVGLEELARSWGTITYEVLCLLGERAQRAYQTGAA